MTELTFYTQQKTPRVEYIVSTLLSAIGIQRFEITTDYGRYKSFSGVKINYSSERSGEREVYIMPVSLLFENDLRKQNVECFEWNTYPAFYKSDGDIPFDIFSASFYLLTRYEEYVPHSLDEYGRYAHTNSLAYKNDFLHLPLVNMWLLHFKNVLLGTFPTLTCHSTAFKFVPTYDIDMAWSYLHKGVVRNVAGGLKSLLKGKWPELRERVAVINARTKDPFDIYERLDQLHKSITVSPYYFFLLSKDRKGYDKNIDPGNKEFQNLIRTTANAYNVGIHPSWQSGDDTGKLKNEIDTLRKITGTAVTSSRQHYIRMTLPQTYRNLVEYGIKADFSMGYGSINGFRASFCLPFYWYDLQLEKQTDLLLYPFCYMEANSYYEQRFSLEQAENELKHYAEITKKVKGVLITIFHNHTLGNKYLFNGWMEMYERFCRTVLP